MIRLDKSNRSLGVVLGGAVATNQLHVITSFTDKYARDDTASAYLLGETQVATTNGATDVTICNAPPQNVTRDIDYVSVRNRDTAAVTVSIEYDDNGTDYVVYSATLAVGDFLVYTHEAGWFVQDSSGRRKTTAGVGLPASSTDNAFPRWDGAGGDTLQNSGVTCDDSNNVTGIAGLTITGNLDTNVTPSGAWAIDQANANQLVTIANDGTYDLAAGSGIIIVHNNSTAAVGIFVAFAGSTVEWLDPSTAYSATADTASSTNVYYNGSTAYRIQNKTGGSVNYYITTIKTRAST